MGISKHNIGTKVLYLGRTINLGCKELINQLNAKGYIVTVRSLLDVDESGCFSRLLESFELVVIELDDLNEALLEILRRETAKPIVVLGVGESYEERITCLKLGVDDCIASPYSPVEVELRMAAILRRSLAGVVGCVGQHDFAEELIDEAGVSLNPHTQTVSIGSEALVVTQVEFKLLWLLMFYKGRILSKPYTYQRVLGREYGAFDRAIDMHLSRVRKKLSTIGFAVDRIKTVRGQGYAFC